MEAVNMSVLMEAVNMSVLVVALNMQVFKEASSFLHEDVETGFKCLQIWNSNYAGGNGERDSFWKNEEVRLRIHYLYFCSTLMFFP